MEMQEAEKGLRTSTTEYLGQDAFVRGFSFCPTGPPSGCGASSRPAAAQLPQAIFPLYHHLY